MPPEIRSPWEDFIFDCFEEYRLTLPNGRLSSKLWKEKMKLWHDRWTAYHSPKRRGAFVPPTPDEVSEYSRSIDWPLDGVAFVLSYEQKDWMVGRSKMRNWRSAIQRWKRDRIQTKHVPARSADLLSPREAREPPDWFAFMCRHYPDSIYVRQWTEGENFSPPKWASQPVQTKKVVWELIETPC